MIVLLINESLDEGAASEYYLNGEKMILMRKRVYSKSTIKGLLALWGTKSI